VGFPDARSAAAIPTSRFRSSTSAACTLRSHALVTALFRTASAMRLRTSFCTSWTGPGCLNSRAGAMLLKVRRKRALSQAMLSRAPTFFHRLPPLNQPQPKCPVVGAAGTGGKAAALFSHLPDQVWAKPRDGRVAHAIGLGNVDQHVAAVAALTHLGLLVQRQLRRSTHVDATGFCTANTKLCTGAIEARHRSLFDHLVGWDPEN
jgi:hypothetical protein